MGSIIHGTKIHKIILAPPYGDNPIDHEWIKEGFKYYDIHKRELDND